MTDPHLTSLIEQHRKLDEEVAKLGKILSSDDTQLRALKIKKLRLKDEISGLEEAAQEVPE